MKLSPIAASRIAEILIVDDNDHDVFLARAAFDEARLTVSLHHVSQGEKCMQFLRKQPPYADAPSPDLILLDIHMPVMDGYEVMRAVADDPALRHLAVVILTTSCEAADIQKMYGLRCSSYITKSVDFNSFVGTIGKLAGYWLTVVIVPQTR